MAGLQTIPKVSAVEIHADCCDGERRKDMPGMPENASGSSSPPEVPSDSKNDRRLRKPAVVGLSGSVHEMSSVPASKQDIELAETAAWLDLLYGSCSDEDGYIIVVSASRKNMLAAFKPSEKVLAAELMQESKGCYSKINLMDYEKIRERSKHAVGGIDEVTTVVSFHLDVDAGKSEKYVGRRHALWALDSMPVPPTLVINSNGDSGGFHAYWCLKHPLTVSNQNRKEIQSQATAWMEQLKELCGGRLDNTSNLDRVLRCVGVERTDGGKVCTEYYEPSRVYEVSDLVVR